MSSKSADKGNQIALNLSKKLFTTILASVRWIDGNALSLYLLTTKRVLDQQAIFLLLQRFLLRFGHAAQHWASFRPLLPTGKQHGCAIFWSKFDEIPEDRRAGLQPRLKLGKISL